MLVVELALLAAGVTPAATGDQTVLPNAPAPGLPAPLGDDELIIREVFQSHLPTTLEKYALRLWLRPHLGDFTNNDYLRLSAGVRYGLTEDWEISAGSDLYFSHGFGDVRLFHRNGVARILLGTKVNLGQPLFAGWDTATGVDYVFPPARPPANLTDGLRHCLPYITFSHRLAAHPHVRIFWGVRLDVVTRTSVPGEFGRNDLQDSSVGATGGFVIDRRKWHYTFETAFATTRWISGSAREVFMVRPGVLWEIPSRRNPHLRSNWVVGAAVSSVFGPGGTGLGASLKLRYNLDLKSLFGHPPPTPVR